MSTHWWGYFYNEEPDKLYTLGASKLSQEIAERQMKELPVRTGWNEPVLQRILLMKPELSMSALKSAHPKWYDEGYQKGLHWDCSWRPGGPYGLPPNVSRVWQAGFTDGLQRRLIECPKFAKWWAAWRPGNEYRQFKESDDA